MVSAVKRKSIDSTAVDNEDSAGSGDAGKTSKKPRSSATPSCPSTSSAGAASESPATKEDQKTKLLSQLRVGSRIEVWWTGDKRYYPGTVASGIPGGGKYEYFVHYDDGDRHYLDLREEQFRIIKGGKSSRSPSSLTDSDLVVPDEIDTSKLPEGWEKIVRAELKACGLGADEEYQRQLEAYDSSDDDAGEPPKAPTTRKRMGRDRAAVHYKISKNVATALLKIVDENLERAGIDTSRSNFTEDDDRLVEELIAKDLKESGNTIVRPGFWEKVHKEYFSGRGFTVKMVKDRRSNQQVKKNKKSNGTRATGKKSEPSANAVGPTANAPGKKFTDADLKLVAQLVETELEETNGDRVRCGFWGKVVEKHFAGRGFTAEQLRLQQYNKRNKTPQMDERDETTEGVSSDHFTDAEDTIIREAVAQHKREHGSDKLPRGFWPGVIEAHSMKRGAQQLARRWHSLKQTGGATLKAGIDIRNEEEEKTALPGGFTDEEFQSMEKLVREELKAAGSERVRPGFWEGVFQKSFSDRTTTSKALCNLYCKIKKMKSAAADNDKQKTKSSHGEQFTAEEDEAIITEAVKETRDHGKLRNGFWPKVAEKHSLNRTPKQLSYRWSILKSKEEVDLSVSPPSDSEAATSDQHRNNRNTESDSKAPSGPSKCSDTVPLSDDLIMLPAYQATTAMYPPRSRVIYRPSSGASDVFGSVVKVGIYPDQDNLYVYTIADDAGDHHERIPERFLDKI